MRKIIVFTILLVFAITSFSQESASIPHVTDTDFYKKSRTQKTFAWILTGVGVTAVTTGLLTQDYVDAFTDAAEEKNSSFPAVYATGVVCIAGGIVLFVASSKNKKKANAPSIFINIEKAPLQYAMIHKQLFPALEERSFIKACSIFQPIIKL